MIEVMTTVLFEANGKVETFLGARVWERFVRLAKAYGWAPKELSPARQPYKRRFQLPGGDLDVPHSGRAFHARVLASTHLSPIEAQALADALAKSLDDLPDHDATPVLSSETLPGGIRHVVPLREPSPFEEFSGEGKTKFVVPLIRFLRTSGGCDLWRLQIPKSVFIP